MSIIRCLGQSKAHATRLCQRYIKSKEEQHVFHPMSRLVQSADLNPIELCGMNLTEKSEINNSQVQLTSGNSCRKIGQNYLQTTSSLW